MPPLIKILLQIWHELKRDFFPRIIPFLKRCDWSIIIHNQLLLWKGLAYFMGALLLLAQFLLSKEIPLVIEFKNKLITIIEQLSGNGSIDSDTYEIKTLIDSWYVLNITNPIFFFAFMAGFLEFIHNFYQMFNGDELTSYRNLPSNQKILFFILMCIGIIIFSKVFNLFYL